MPDDANGQPIFYPVLAEEYARQIARDWNASSPSTGHRGFVTRFQVPSAYAARFPIRTVRGRVHKELWVRADELDEFSSQIVGEIEVIAEFHGDSKADEPG